MAYNVNIVEEYDNPEIGELYQALEYFAYAITSDRETF